MKPVGTVLRADEAMRILEAEGYCKEKHFYRSGPGGSNYAWGYMLGLTTVAGLYGGGWLAIKGADYLHSNSTVCAEEDLNDSHNFAMGALILLPLIGAIAGLVIPILIGVKIERDTKSQVDRINASRHRAMAIFAANYGDIRFHSPLNAEHIVALLNETDEKVWRQFSEKMSLMQMHQVSLLLKKEPQSSSVEKNKGIDKRDLFKKYENAVDKEAAAILIERQNDLQEEQLSKLAGLQKALQSSNTAAIRWNYVECCPYFKEDCTLLDEYVVKNMTIENCKAIKSLGGEFENHYNNFYRRNRDEILKNQFEEAD